MVHAIHLKSGEKLFSSVLTKKKVLERVAAVSYLKSEILIKISHFDWKITSKIGIFVYVLFYDIAFGLDMIE